MAVRHIVSSSLFVLLGASSNYGLAESCPARLRWRPETLRPVYAPGEGFYCYAPCVIQDRGAEYVFACRNEKPDVIRDHVYAFHRTKGVLGLLIVALRPANGAADWDRFHVCDPSVVAGRFKDRETVYRYAMFYLGNDVDACENNQIGLAFAKELSGPWKRFGPPIVPYERRGVWGTGQPSAVSLDRAGRVLLFYTRGEGGTAGYVREIDLSDAEHPRVGPAVRLSTHGLTGITGRGDWLNNFDVVLDKRGDRFYIVRERHPYPTEAPTFIGAQLQIASLAASELRNPEAVWRVEGDLSPAITGFPRNHNAGFARTANGELPGLGVLRIFFASSQAEPALRGRFAPWTYALHEITADLPGGGTGATRPSSSPD